MSSSLTDPPVLAIDGVAEALSLHATPDSSEQWCAPNGRSQALVRWVPVGGRRLEAMQHKSAETSLLPHVAVLDRMMAYIHRDGNVEVAMMPETARQRKASQRRRAAASSQVTTSLDRVDSVDAVRRPAGSDAHLTEAGRRRLASSTCGWCAGPIDVKARGRIPKWCSPGCRQRAWEQNRAAACGLAAVRVVERRVEVPVPADPTAKVPRHQEWATLLQQLSAQLDNGALYDRDLPELAGAVREVLEAFERRTKLS